MSWLKNIFFKIWHDSVGGNVVAYFLIIFGTWLISVLPSVNEFIAKYAAKNGIPLSRFYWVSFGVLSVLFCLYVLFRFLDHRRLQKKYHKLYHTQSCKLLDIENVLRDSPRITKITVSGVEGVGKTTLIENLCSNKNKNQVTQGRGAYVLNFSNTDYKYAAVFDGSGQSQATQNDLALNADILLIIVDHNQSREKINILKNRLQRHRQFIGLLIDRFETSRKVPKVIYFIVNKRDLWRQSGTDRQNFEEFCNLQEELVRERFSNSHVVRVRFSNEITSDRTFMREEISKIIK